MASQETSAAPSDTQCSIFMYSFSPFTYVQFFSKWTHSTPDQIIYDAQVRCLIKSLRGLPRSQQLVCSFVPQQKHKNKFKQEVKSNTKELWVKTIVATEKGYKKKEKTSQKVRFKRSFIINDGNFTSSPPFLSLLPSPLAIRRLKGQPITPRALHAVLLMKSGGRKVCERACMCVFFGMKRANGSRLIMRAGEHTLAGALHRRYLC